MNRIVRIYGENRKILWNRPIILSDITGLLLIYLTIQYSIICDNPASIIFKKSYTPNYIANRSRLYR